MNWLVIILVGLAAFGLLVFLIVRNRKDEKNFVRKVENDYPKPRSEEGDVDIDDTKT